MRVYILITTLGFGFLLGCQNKVEGRVEEKNPIISSQLRSELDKLITYSDSMVTTLKTNKKIESIWIEFLDLDGDCISLETHYSYYDEKQCDGYFYYRGKIISVYGMKNNFSKNFINSTENFTKDNKIPKLKNYTENGEIFGGIFNELYAIETNGKLRRIAKA